MGRIWRWPSQSSEDASEGSAERAGSNASERVQHWKDPSTERAPVHSGGRDASGNGASGQRISRDRVRSHGGCVDSVSVRSVGDIAARVALPGGYWATEGWRDGGRCTRGAERHSAGSKQAL